MYKLIYKDGGDVRSFPVEHDEVKIGRAADNDLVVNDFGVSRHHAKVVVENDQCYVQDLNSRNGTRVNSVLVSKSAIRDGDEISLGKFSFRLSTITDEVELQDLDSGEFGPGTFIKPITDIRKIIPEPKLDSETEEDALVVSEIRKSNEILSILVQVAQSLITVQPLDQVLNLVMDLIFDYLPAERGFLMLYEDESGELIPKVVKHRDPGADREKITISRTITSKVFQEKVSILTSDAQMDPRFNGGDSIIFHQIRSAMCAPLWNKDDVIGVVFVDSTTRSGSFMPADLDVLTALANYAAIGIEQARLNDKIKEEIRRRSQLERYHSPSVINRIMSFSKGESSNDAQDLDVTVMFTDIVGFTSMSEKMEPSRVSLLLNDYFGEMTEIIFRHDGTLDKFIGDAIMAVFGAPFPMEDHAIRAVTAAIEMRERLKQLNEESFQKHPLQVRVGINSGRVVAGDIGSPKRIEYTVLGNTVNIASRLESGVAKPGQIVIGEETFQLVRDVFQLQELGEFNLKGLQKSIHVYGVLSDEAVVTRPISEVES